MPQTDPQSLDHLVVGASLVGMHHALLARSEGRGVLVVEREPRPGGAVRTLRSEGFRCELGPIALPAEDWRLFSSVLPTPPPSTGLLPGAEQGWVLGRQGLEAAIVDGKPTTGRTGLEDLVGALRRELGRDLRLGRAVQRLLPATPDGRGWRAELGGEVVAHLQADSATLAVPLAAAAELLAPLDAGLQDLLGRLRWNSRSLVFLGFWQDERTSKALSGYGVLLDPPRNGISELIHCSSALPGVTMAGKCLVRIEVEAAIEGTDDAAQARSAEDALRTIHDLQAPLAFWRVHNLAEPIPDSTLIELKARLQSLLSRTPGLAWLDPALPRRR